MSTLLWTCAQCHEQVTFYDTDQSPVAVHMLWHRMRRVPEHQDASVKAEYSARIPFDFSDRMNEARHAIDHGILYYSRPAFDAWLDYAEITKQRQVLNTPIPAGLSLEQIAHFKKEKDDYVKGVLMLGEARKLGATGDRGIYPILANAYVLGSMYGITADFLKLKAVPNHPLEECPDPPK